MMLSRIEIINYLRKNKAEFEKNYHIKKIGLFGSFARNEQTENSDIDIIIDISQDATEIFEKRLKLKELLKQRFHKEIDICHERAIKPIFRDIILNETIYV